MPGEAPSRAKQATLLWIPRRGACAAAGPAGPAAVTVARVGPAAGAPALRLTLLSLRPARLVTMIGQSTGPARGVTSRHWRHVA